MFKMTAFFFPLIHHFVNRLRSADSRNFLSTLARRGHWSPRSAAIVSCVPPKRPTVDIRMRESVQFHQPMILSQWHKCQPESIRYRPSNRSPPRIPRAAATLFSNTPHDPDRLDCYSIKPARRGNDFGQIGRQCQSVDANRPPHVCLILAGKVKHSRRICHRDTCRLHGCQ